MRYHCCVPYAGVSGLGNLRVSVNADSVEEAREEATRICRAAFPGSRTWAPAAREHGAVIHQRRGYRVRLGYTPIPTRQYRHFTWENADTEEEARQASIDLLLRECPGATISTVEVT